MHVIEGKGRVTCILCFCLLTTYNIKDATSYIVKNFASTYTILSLDIFFLHSSQRPRKLFSSLLTFPAYDIFAFKKVTKHIY